MFEIAFVRGTLGQILTLEDLGNRGNIVGVVDPLLGGKKLEQCELTQSLRAALFFPQQPKKLYGGVSRTGAACPLKLQLSDSPEREQCGDDITASLIQVYMHVFSILPAGCISGHSVFLVPTSVESYFIAPGGGINPWSEVLPALARSYFIAIQKFHHSLVTRGLSGGVLIFPLLGLFEENIVFSGKSIRIPESVSLIIALMVMGRYCNLIRDHTRAANPIARVIFFCEGEEAQDLQMCPTEMMEILGEPRPVAGKTEKNQGSFLEWSDQAARFDFLRALSDQLNSKGCVDSALQVGLEQMLDELSLFRGNDWIQSLDYGAAFVLSKVANNVYKLHESDAVKQVKSYVLKFKLPNVPENRADYFSNLRCVMAVLQSEIEEKKKGSVQWKLRTLRVALLSLWMELDLKFNQLLEVTRILPAATVRIPRQGVVEHKARNPGKENRNGELRVQMSGHTDLFSCLAGSSKQLCRPPADEKSEDSRCQEGDIQGSIKKPKGSSQCGRCVERGGSNSAPKMIMELHGVPICLLGKKGVMAPRAVHRGRGDPSLAIVTNCHAPRGPLGTKGSGAFVVWHGHSQRKEAGVEALGAYRGRTLSSPSVQGGEPRCGSDHTPLSNSYH